MKLLQRNQNQQNCKRVLTIDDIPAFTRLVQLCLESSGTYEVATANDSEEALKVARAFQPDLILLDLVMPLINGNEIATLIRQDPETQKIPIIFLSGYCPEHTEKAKLCNFEGQQFLAKPVSRDNLIKAVDGVLLESA